MKRKIIFLFVAIGLTLQVAIAQLSTLPSYNVSSYKSYGWIYFNEGTTDFGELFTHFKSSFFANDEDTMVMVRTWEDRDLNYDHYRYQQFYKDILVEGCEFTEHGRNGKVVYAHGKICPDIYRQFSTDTISEALALERLLDGGEYWETYLGQQNWWGLDVPYEEYSIDDAVFAWEDSTWEAALKNETGDNNATYYPNGELVFTMTDMSHIEYSMDRQYFTLAWKFNIVCLFPDINIDVYVDALTGNVCKVYNRVHYDGPADIPGLGSQTIDTKHRGWPNNDYVLQTDNGDYDIHTKYDAFGPWSTLSEVDDSDDNWGSSEQLATAPHWMITKAWAYFTTVHGHEGMHNNNVVRVRADYTGLEGAQYQNSWTFDIIKVGYFGNGTYSADLSVMAHEFTHGVDEHEGNLSYSNESGALDESYADIFGFCTREWVTSTVNWTIGASTSLNRDKRSLSNPNSLGIHWSFNIDSTEVTEAAGQPDTYGGTYWHPWQSSGVDAGGVHTNSGVMNHWFYMLAAGDAGVNDLSDTYVVNGIGIDKAAKITYYNFVNNMQSSSQYIDAMEGAIFFSLLYYGPCSNEHIQTENAWYAAGLGNGSACANVSIDETESNFKIYPNPASDMLNVDFDNSELRTIEIYSIDGQLLKTFSNVGSVHCTIDISELAKGTYIVNVIGNSTTWTKFVKQ